MQKVSEIGDDSIFASGLFVVLWTYTCISPYHRFDIITPNMLITALVLTLSSVHWMNRVRFRVDLLSRPLQCYTSPPLSIKRGIRGINQSLPILLCNKEPNNRDFPWSVSIRTLQILTHRETETQRHTHTQTIRNTQTHTHTHTYTHTHTNTHTHTHKQTHNVSVCVCITVQNYWISTRPIRRKLKNIIACGFLYYRLRVRHWQYDMFSASTCSSCLYTRSLRHSSPQFNGVIKHTWLRSLTHTIIRHLRESRPIGEYWIVTSLEHFLHNKWGSQWISLIILVSHIVSTTFTI